MKVLSEYPVIVQNTSNFSSLDGASNPKLVLGFQKWANRFKGARLTEDGKWGKNTSSAWNKYGVDYQRVLQGAKSVLDTAAANTSPERTDKLGTALNKYSQVKESGILDTIGSIFGRKQPVEQGAMDYSQEQPQASGMSKGAKIGLAIGGVVLLGTVIYLATRKKGK